MRILVRVLVSVAAPSLCLLSIWFQARAMTLRAADRVWPTWATLSVPALESPPGPESSDPADLERELAFREPGSKRVEEENKRGEPTLAEPRAFPSPRPPKSKPSSEPQRVRFGPTAKASGEALVHGFTRSGVRFVPEREGTRMRGFRLVGIHPGSVAHRLGLEEGDRVDDIDGHDLSTPAGVLAVYASSKTASSLEVHLTRKGRPVTLTYHLL